MARKRTMWTYDIEAETALFGRCPLPFLVCAYCLSTGQIAKFWGDDCIEEFVKWASKKNADFYAHNGGKYDIQFLFKWFMEVKTKKALLPKIINGRTVRTHLGNAILFDSVAKLPVSLKDHGKSPVDMNWFDDRDQREAHKDEITDYCVNDCKILAELIRDFHDEVGNTKLTIASSAFANMKSYGIDPKKTSHYYDAVFRPYYFGGRCEARYVGYTGAVDVYDIASAYPNAMCSPNPIGTEYVDFGDMWHKLPEDTLEKAFIEIEAVAYDCFPTIIDKKNEYPVDGIKRTYNITGHEFLTAMRFGLVEPGFHVKHCYAFTQGLDLTDFIMHWFDIKAQAKLAGNKNRYTIAKLIMNSLYGKFAQDPTNFADYKMVESGTVLEFEDQCEGWLEYEHGPYFDMWWRPNLTKIELRYEDDDWKAQPLYNNVATAASITGRVRAQLLDAMYKVGADNVLYMDTDSLIVKAGTDVSALELGKALGQWEHEGRFDKGGIAGRKLYGFIDNDGKTKTASKGVKLDYDDIMRVVAGEPVTYKNPFMTHSKTGIPTALKRTVKKAETVNKVTV